MAEYKLDPPKMGKVLCEAARLRTAEFLQSCQENKLPFLRDLLIHHTFFYNFAFMKETLLKKYPAAVVEETMDCALEEYFQQFVQHSPSDDLADLRAMAREDAATVRHFLDDALHGDESALYRLSKKLLQDICSLEGSPLLGADKILEASLTIPLWVDCAYLNDAYDIVPAPRPSGEGSPPTPYGQHPPNPLRKRLSAKRTAAESPSSQPPPPSPAPSRPPSLGERLRKALWNIPVGKYLAGALVVALLVYSGYAYDRITFLERELASTQGELLELQDKLREETPASGDSGTALVWISGANHQYHSTPSCGDMNASWLVSRDRAIAEGYGQCSQCW